MTIPRRPHLACRVALPTKFAEYLAIGKPVLVNTVDETEQIVREHGCGFVAAPDPADMTRAIREALATPHERLVDMGRCGRAYVERELNWSVIGRRYKEFMESVLQEGGR
jgi:glycosyltransferase involved in cell wall biosynthesis